jgi:hypothetical protein
MEWWWKHGCVGGGMYGDFLFFLFFRRTNDDDELNDGTPVCVLFRLLFADFVAVVEKWRDE